MTKAQEYDSNAKKMEIELKHNTSPNNVIQLLREKDEIDNLYLNSMKAKLALL